VPSSSQAVEGETATSNLVFVQAIDLYTWQAFWQVPDDSTLLVLLADVPLVARIDASSSHAGLLGRAVSVVSASLYCNKEQCVIR